MENREDGLESKHGRSASEGRGKCHEVSTETRESCAYTTTYSPRSAATGELAGASERQGHVSLAFVVNQ